MTIETTNVDNGITEEQAMAMLMGKSSPKSKASASEDEDNDADLDLEDEGDEEEDDLEDTEDTEEYDDGDEEDDSYGDEEEDEDEDDSEEDSDEDEDEQDSKASKKTDEVPDDAKVKITVHGKTEEFTVAQLKRIAADRTAIHAKSVEADKIGNSAVAAARATIGWLENEIAGYTRLDWLVAQQEMDPGTFKWHRQNYERLATALNQAKGAANTLVTAKTQVDQAEVARAAQESIAELKRDIPGWNNDVYYGLIDWCVSQGIDQEAIETETNPKVIKLLYKAFKAEQGRNKVAKKVKATPKALKSSTPHQDNKASLNTRLKKKIRSGNISEDDAEAILMSRWA